MGDQILTKIITIAAEGQVTDAQVAAYLANYATKSTEVTGHASNRLTDDTINLYADPDGTHTERLIEACWILGRPREWRRLRRWAHMLGFGGHFLTKSRRYSITFAMLRNQRVVFRRSQSSGPERTEPQAEPTTLVVNFLEFVGAGWQTPADAMLANTSAAMAREHQQAAREALQTLAPNGGSRSRRVAAGSRSAGSAAATCSPTNTSPRSCGCSRWHRTTPPRLRGWPGRSDPP